MNMFNLLVTSCLLILSKVKSAVEVKNKCYVLKSPCFKKSFLSSRAVVTASSPCLDSPLFIRGSCERLTAHRGL